MVSIKVFPSKQRHKQKKAMHKSLNLETLMICCSAPFIVWFLFFCRSETRLFHSVNDHLKISKSLFLTKRKTLKNYLDDSLPNDASQDTTIQLTSDRKVDNDIVTTILKTAVLPKPESILSLKRGKRQTTSRQKDEKEVTSEKPKIIQKELTTRYPGQKVVAAYLESPTTLQRDVKPLPRRQTSASKLQIKVFPEIANCSTFLQDFGRSAVNDFPSEDPYLPWIHDFFPTSDGKEIKFIAQNRRNCKTGQGQEDVMKFWSPQVSLFQPVPVTSRQRDGTKEPVFRLADSLQNATTKETRFICRFHSAANHSEVTLSKFPFNYEYVSWRKGQLMLQEENSKKYVTQSPFWISQLLFTCPVPTQFQRQIQDGKNVVDDQAKLWIDLVPIRTPVRASKVLLSQEQTGGAVSQEKMKDLFSLASEYGKNHVLPAISDSGRWANLPICRPPQQNNSPVDENSEYKSTQRDLEVSAHGVKPHRLVACTWSSAAYQRRGNAVTVRDSHGRLREWILFQKLVGFNHVYIYDNSPADTKKSATLEAVAQEFPSDFVTYIRWPCTICSNNRPMHKNPGDRSSQYAAEASCRERFGPLTEWMAFIDTDEYLVPMKNVTWEELLKEMEQRGIQVLKMRSSRGLPRHDLMEVMADQDSCKSSEKRSAAIRKLTPQPCLEPKRTEMFLKVYNCDYIKPPRPSRFARAMKQIYRPSYVLSHYVHYSTVTTDIARYHKDFNNLKPDEPLPDWEAAGSDKEVFLDELTQGTLIHARSVLPHETIYRTDQCHSKSRHKCPLGYVCPNSTEWIDDKLIPNNPNPFKDESGNYCNCWRNEHVEQDLVPMLEEVVKHHSMQNWR